MASVVIVPADSDGGTAGHQVALSMGENTITVSVTAEDDTRQDYVITVTNAASSDASLSSVMVGDAEITAEADGSYAHSVGNDVEMVTVAATATHADAMVAIAPADADDMMDGHQVALSVGDNAVTITVTAANGTSTADHMLTVTRGQSSDVSLASFTVAGTEVTADEMDGTYTHSVGMTDDEVTVSATAGHADAMAAITSPADADDMTDGHQVDLAVGETEVTATVTAQDGSTATYTLTITRPATPGIMISGTASDDDGNPTLALGEGESATYTGQAGHHANG